MQRVWGSFFTKTRYINSLLLLLPARRDSIAQSLLRQRVWLAGWLSVTRRYCIKMAKPIWKKYSTIWKHHHSNFLRPLRRYTIPRGTPTAGALNTRGWEKRRFSCNFQRISPFMSETVRY